MIRRLTMPVACALGALLLAAPLQARAPQEGVESPGAPPIAEAPTSVKGTLTVRAVQGTADGPPVAGASVQISLVHNGVPVAGRSTELDERGEARLEDLPVGMGVLPVVQVLYKGVTYQQPGERLDAANRDAVVEVVCYETTEIRPEWTVKMRHVMIDRVADGVRVAEILVIDNPAKTTWLGESRGTERPCTSRLVLPEGASKISLGSGFHDWCCTTLDERTLCNHLPLMPGSTELRFGYLLEARAGRAEIEVTAPAPLEQMMVVLPDDIDTPVVEGLHVGGTEQYEETSLRYYHAGPLETGQQARLVLAGLGSSDGAVATARYVSSVEMLKVVAVVGGGLILLAALGLLLGRRTAATPTDS